MSTSAMDGELKTRKLTVSLLVTVPSDLGVMEEEHGNHKDKQSLCR